MKLPAQNKILKEDLKDAPNWVTGIIEPVNSFMQNVYQALNKSIDENNTASQVQELTYITTAAYPTMATAKFQSTLKTKATGLVILQIFDTDTYTPPPGPCYVPWIENNGVIEVSSITGLEASKTYKVRVRLT